MSQPSPTPSFEDGPSFDSGIGMNTTPPKPSPEPSQTAFTKSPSSSNHATIPHDNHTPHGAQSTQKYSRHISFGYPAVGRMQPKSANQDSSRDSPGTASGIPLTLSRPNSAPCITINGRPINAGDAPFLRRSHTPYPLRKVDVSEHDAGLAQNIERVLGPPKGRKTPTLMKAPKLQWDLSRPFLVTPSTSTLGSRASEGEEQTQGEEEDSEVGGRSTRGERASTPVPELTYPRHEDEFRRENGEVMPDAYTHLENHNYCSNTISASPPLPNPSTTHPRSSPPSHIPALLKTLDATLTPQPHRLSPLSERSEPLTEMSHPGPYTARSTHSLPCSSRPRNAQKITVAAWRSGLRDQVYIDDDNDNEDQDQSQDYDHKPGIEIGTETPAQTKHLHTRETDPSPFTDTHTLLTAEILPVTRVTHDDVRRGQIIIPQPRRGGLVARNAREVVYEEDIGKVGERSVREKVRKRFGGRVKRVWGRFRRWFCNKGVY